LHCSKFRCGKQLFQVQMLQAAKLSTDMASSCHAKCGTPYLPSTHHTPVAYQVTTASVAAQMACAGWGSRPWHRRRQPLQSSVCPWRPCRGLHPHCPTQGCLPCCPDAHGGATAHSLCRHWCLLLQLPPHPHCPTRGCLLCCHGGRGRFRPVRVTGGQAAMPCGEKACSNCFWEHSWVCMCVRVCDCGVYVGTCASMGAFCITCSKPTLKTSTTKQRHSY
jgi:hypothetical protein